MRESSALHMRDTFAMCTLAQSKHTAKLITANLSKWIARPAKTENRQNSSSSSSRANLGNNKASESRRKATQQEQGQ